MKDKRFLPLIENSIKKNRDRIALADYDGTKYLYSDFAMEIEKLHVYFKEAGIKKGDKISIAGRNSSRWAITFFATISYGAVAVSILHDFDKNSIEYIVNHSESRMLFTDNSIWEKLEEKNIPLLENVFSLDDNSLLKQTSESLVAFHEGSKLFFEEKYKMGFDVDTISYHKEEPEELAVLNYTSGTMSNPKGVMIPFRSLWSNTKFANDNLEFVKAGDGVVCMLPMAHTYGLAFEILNSISMGCSINFLNKVPSPKIIIEAFARVKPKLVLAVPLIIEKIITKNIFPKIQRQPTKTLMHIPIIGNIIKSKIRKGLIDFFGGNMDEVVIGGAALNDEVETFLQSINFPYTVGYGMTECGPLICYSYWKEFKKKSCGKVVDRMEVKIDSANPEKEVGEILAKGSNLMLGYFKNPEATEDVMLPGGWMKTGDLGIMDRNNFVFIKGRSKNMILGPSGQNIYPEEIEDQLKQLPLVEECLVIDDKGKIVALIYPDTEMMKAKKITKEDCQDLLENDIAIINSMLPSYSKISQCRILTEEFEKTPKRSIRRFKYQTKN